MGSADDDDTSHYEGVLLEEIRDQVKTIAESVSGLNVKVSSVDQRLSKVEQNTELIPSIQVAITDQTKQLNDHEARVASLEEATV
jgi:septation ring formation regulator EzrA